MKDGSEREGRGCVPGGKGDRFAFEKSDVKGCSFARRVCMLRNRYKVVKVVTPASNLA